jgi:hypothetical protein
MAKKESKWYAAVWVAVAAVLLVAVGITSAENDKKNPKPKPSYSEKAPPKPTFKLPTSAVPSKRG